MLKLDLIFELVPLATRKLITTRIKVNICNTFFIFLSKTTSIYLAVLLNIHIEHYIGKE